MEADAHLAGSLGHLTGTMAGATARRANVKRLLLTHFFTPRYALQETHAAAAKEFANVALVEEGLAYEV
jgi:ribonuclease BN (tRNA processing enzyme)